MHCLGAWEIFGGISNNPPPCTVQGLRRSVYDHCMLSELRNSTLFKLLLAMVLIVSLGFVSMLSSFITTEATQGAAAAINQAGTLRMQSYRIATRLVFQQEMDPMGRWEQTRKLVEEFEQRLHNPRLTTFLPKDPGEPLQKAYDRVERKWSRTIRPLLNVYVSITAPPGMLPLDPDEIDRNPSVKASRSAIRSRYLTTVDRFVADIDQLVRALEDDAEYKIRRLRFIELVSLFITISVVAITVYLMQHRILHPLRNLLKTAQRLRNGEFHVRARYTGEDELGRLGNAMNSIASDLSKLYGELEQRVAQKTHDLELSNRSLDLLYQASTRLNRQELSSRLFQELLNDVSQLVGLGSGTICLRQGEGHQFAERLAGPDLERFPELCTPEACERCMGDGEKSFMLNGIPGHDAPVLSIPIRDLDQHQGALLLEMRQDQPLKDWQKALLQTLADNIGQAIGSHRRLTESRRLVLYDERAVIARELHDSLAQSLSYLKIQVSLLQKRMQQNDPPEVIQPVLQELREGLNNAYRQLRELLTTFRIRMDERGLETALRETLEDFSQRCDIAVTLDYQLGSTLALTPNQEIHVLQIVREALSNIMRHSQADQAEILITSERGQVDVVVRDDGIGLSEIQSRPNHYGMAIIQERAERLGGELEVTSNRPRGTLIRLRFTPASNGQARANHPNTTQVPKT